MGCLAGDHGAPPGSARSSGRGALGVAILIGLGIDFAIQIHNRIEEEVVVTKDGCEIITNFPSDRLISCGLPGCEVF